VDEVGVVVGSVDRSLTIFPVEDPGALRTVGLGPDGTPVGVAVRGSLAAVPMGLVPAVVVVDLSRGTVLRTVALPQGSGATGAAFLNDSIVLVANPGLNSVSPVNVRSGTRGDAIPTGAYPQAVVVAAGRVFVVNAELENFAPTGPGTLTVLNATTLTAMGTVALSGMNPGAAALGPDGRLYVVHGGNFGMANGSLSVVDPGTLVETAHHPGFGDFPGGLAIRPDGSVLVSSFAAGIMVWEPSAGFIRGPGNAVEPGGIGSASGVGVDAEGRVYTLKPDCQNPSSVFRLGESFQQEVEIPAGICPTGIAFTQMEDG